MLKRAFIVAMFFSFVLVSNPNLHPQTPPPLPENPLHETVNVDLVDVYVTAIDKKGNFVTDLRPEEITVREDGALQSIHSFNAFAGVNNEIPLTLALVVDTSASMDDEIDGVRKLDVAKNVGTSLIQQLQPMDRMMVVGFNDEQNQTEMMSDHNAIEAALRDLRVRFRQTAMFDAVTSTINQMKTQWGRKILVLCSDGQDNMSEHKFDEVVEKAMHLPELTVVVMGVVNYFDQYHWYGPHRDAGPGKQVLQKLADATGGYAFYPSDKKDLERAQELIRSFVRSQYSLAYEPSNHKIDKTWRKIEITCSRKDITLRYRNGYYAE